jgi:hypothetical protein
LVRLSLPTRIPLSKAFLFASLFFCVQLFEHTSFLFSLLYLAFFLLSVVAFNVADGFTRLTGAYIFWYSTLIVIVGVTWKAVVGEAGDSNLYSPLLDMTLYSASMGMLLLVALLNKKVDLRGMGLGGGFSSGELNYTSAGLGCCIVGYGIITAQGLFGQAPGGIVSALVQVNVFPQLGIILSTIGVIKDSGGRRSTNVINLMAMGYFFFWGLMAFSKQGMFTPIICWAVGAFYARFRLRTVNYIALAAVVIVSFGFLAPLSEARDLAEGVNDPMGRIAIIEYQLTHWTQFKQHVDGLQGYALNAEGQGTYYSTPQSGLIQRMSMIFPDDALFTYTAMGHYEGIAPVLQYFGNDLPHFLSPNKQITYSGNFYDHEMGRGLAADDYSTGISFSPVAEAYHCEGWGGIFWLLPGLWVILFTTTDFVVGDMSKYPWGLMVVVWFAHSAPETLLGGIIYFIGYGNFGMLFAIVVVTRFAPILGVLFGGRSVPQQMRNPRALPAMSS